jgi:hypothetical protein
VSSRHSPSDAAGDPWPKRLSVVMPKHAHGLLDTTSSASRFTVADLKSERSRL